MPSPCSALHYSQAVYSLRSYPLLCLFPRFLQAKKGLEHSAPVTVLLLCLGEVHWLESQVLCHPDSHGLCLHVSYIGICRVAIPVRRRVLLLLTMSSVGLTVQKAMLCCSCSYTETYIIKNNTLECINLSNTIIAHYKGEHYWNSLIIFTIKHLQEIL